MANPHDEHHRAAVTVTHQLGNARIVTSQMVLVEFLTQLGSESEQLRQKAVEVVRELKASPNVDILPQSSDQFDSAFSMYSSRLDKYWSMTDCASFIIMERLNIVDALAHDHNFEQAGFVALLRGPIAPL